MRKFIDCIKCFFTEPVVVDLLCIIIPALFFVLVATFTGCSVTKEIPVQNVEKIEYRDSLVYIHDTVTVEIPREKVVQVLPKLDTSILNTSLAESVAYVDTAKMSIYHTLEQKGTVQIQYDTVVKVEYVDRFIEKEVPVEVEVIKYKRDALFWVLVGWTLLTLLVMILRLTIQPQTLVR